MRVTYRYRLYPTAPQVAFLESELREACSLYNAAIEERRGAWQVCRRSINYCDQSKELPAMRADGCLSLVNAHCAQDVLRRVDKTFAAFFARVKRGSKAGFPRFKSSRRYNSITFPQHPRGCRLLETGKIRVHGAGHIKVKLHRPVEGKIKTSTIKREAGRWFVCFSVERDGVPLLASTQEIGIDVGLTTFAAFSDGTKIENPRFYRKAQAWLRRAQRKVARRKKGSNRRRKAVHLLQRAHARVRRTSQICLCGTRVPKGLQDRWHDCPTCGLSAGRDHVSAKVILSRAGSRPSSANAAVVDANVGREAVCFSWRSAHKS